MARLDNASPAPHLPCPSSPGVCDPKIEDGTVGNDDTPIVTYGRVTASAWSCIVADVCSLAFMILNVAQA